MSYSRYLAFLLVALSGLCFGVKASAEVAAPADTTYLLFDYQRSPRMMRMGEFAEAMLLLYVDRIDTLFTPPRRYTPVAAFVQVMDQVEARAAYFDETLYVVTRDYRGRMLRHRVNYAVLFYYLYTDYQIGARLHTWDKIAYRRRNLFARDLYPGTITREEIARDKELYRQLLRYGFLSEALPLGPYLSL